MPNEIENLSGNESIPIRLKNMIFYLLTKLRPKEISNEDIEAKLNRLASTGLSLEQLAIKLDLFNSTAVAIGKIVNKLELFNLPTLSIEQIKNKFYSLIGIGLTTEQIVEKLRIPAFIGLTTEQIVEKLNELTIPGLSVEYIANQLGIYAQVTFSREYIAEKINILVSKGLTTEQIAQELNLCNAENLSIEEIIRKLSLIFSTKLSIDQLITKIDLSISPSVTIEHFITKLEVLNEDIVIEEIAQELGLYKTPPVLSDEEIITKLDLFASEPLSLEKIAQELGASHTTIGKYRNILWNSPLEWENFLKIEEKEIVKRTRSKKLKTKIIQSQVTLQAAGQYNEIEHYLNATHKVGLGKDTMWESLDSKGREIYVKLRIKNEGKTLSDIALQLCKKYIFIESLSKSQSYSEEEYLRYSNAEKEFKKRYSENNNSIEIPMWKVKWADLKRKEQILHILLRKNVGMNPEQTAASLDLEDISIIAKYFTILEYVSLQEIEEFWEENSLISIDMLYQKTLILKQEQFEKGKKVVQEWVQKIEKQEKNTNSNEIKQPLWDKDKRLTNMILILSEYLPKGYFTKTSPLEIGDTTKYNYLAILNQPIEVQEAFFAKLLSVDKAKYYVTKYKNNDINNNINWEAKELWEVLSTEGKKIYVASRLSQGQQKEQICVNLGITNEEINKFLIPQQRILNNQQSNSPIWDLETIIPVKPGEWNTLKREELKLFHVLSRWYKTMTTKQIADSLHISTEVVEAYCSMTNWEPAKLKDYLENDNELNKLDLTQENWYITSAKKKWTDFSGEDLTNEKELVNQGASTSQDTTTVLVQPWNRINSLTPRQEAILGTLESNKKSGRTVKKPRLDANHQSYTSPDIKANKGNKTAKLWVSGRNCTNIVLILSGQYQGCKIGKNELNVDATTIYNYLSILKCSGTDQKDFLMGLISLEKIKKCPRYNKYQNIVSEQQVTKNSSRTEIFNTYRERRMYILARQTDQATNENIAKELGIDIKIVENYLNIEKTLSPEEKEILNAISLKTIIQLKPGEWDILEREELKMFHILSRWHKGIKNEIIAKTLGISLQVVEEYFLKAKRELSIIKQELDIDNERYYERIRQEKQQDIETESVRTMLDNYPQLGILIDLAEQEIARIPFPPSAMEVPLQVIRMEKEIKSSSSLQFNDNNESQAEADQASNWSASYSFMN